MKKKKLGYIIISLILLSLLLVTINGNIQTQVGVFGTSKNSPYKIVHIKILKSGENFGFSKGNIYFNLSKNSIYGREFNTADYSVDKNNELYLDTNPNNNQKLLDIGSAKTYYQSSYVSYLGLFDKVGANKVNYDMRPIYVSRKELNKMYPPQKNMFTNKERITYGILQGAMYDPYSKRYQINSVKINRNWLGQPIKVSIATKNKPNKYIGIYTLTYDNNILAYTLGFNKMKRSIEKIANSDLDDRYKE